jgi:hypothetical protein
MCITYLHNAYLNYRPNKKLPKGPKSALQAEQVGTGYLARDLALNPGELFITGFPLLAAQVCELRPDAPAVRRIRDTDNQAVRLEAVHQLRDVGPHAAQAFRQITQRERLTSLCQFCEGGMFGDRKPDIPERCLETIPYSRRRVKQRKREVLAWARRTALLVHV